AVFVSSLGYQNVRASWQQRNSTSASRYTRVQYSTDGGTTWTDMPTAQSGSGTANTFVNRSVDFTALSGVDNNPNFAFRIVAEFESTAIGSANVNYIGTSGGTYSTGGTIRFDMVTVFADIQPFSIDSQ